MALGFIVAAVSAWASVRWMVGYLQRHTLEIFGYYRIAIAIAAAILLWAGFLK